MGGEGFGMSATKHTILGGKVHVYKREHSGYWQCSTYLAGKNRRESTKEDSLARAKDFARGMSRLLLKFVQQALLVEQATQPWPSVQGRG